MLLKQEHYIPKKFLLIGAAVGIANGLFGAGGGLLLIPLLTNWVGIDKKQAFAMSVVIIVPISAVSAATYFLTGGINLSLALPYLIGGSIGGIVSGKIFSKVSLPWIRIIFSVIMIYCGFRSVIQL